MRKKNTFDLWYEYNTKRDYLLGLLKLLTDTSQLFNSFNYLKQPNIKIRIRIKHFSL